MSEEKKGHAKITLEVELNEALMELIKETSKNMPQMGGMMRRMMQRRSEESEQRDQGEGNEEHSAGLLVEQENLVGCSRNGNQCFNCC